jgi:phosphoglycolate phosphatase-like HAD superfamily hydrolase
MAKSFKRLILFDIDGTLILTKGAGRRALKVALRDEFQVADPCVDIDYGGRTDRSIARELFRINQVEPRIEHFETLFSRYLSELEQFLGQTKGLVLPGVQPLLAALESHAGAHVGLLTGNIRRGAFTKLAHFGIDSFFGFGGFGDEHELREDIAKSGLAEAREYTGHDFSGPQDIIVIGDTPHDITCSRAIGARCMAVCTGYAPRDKLEAAGPAVMVDDLAETDRLMRWIFD